MSKCCEMTFREDVTDHSEIGRTELGRNQEGRENVGNSRVSAVEHSPKFTPISYFWRHFHFWQNQLNFWQWFWRNNRRKNMRRKGYRGVGCVKRSLSKCESICKTYDRIQTSFADYLQNNEKVKSFQCNVLMENGEENQYTTRRFRSPAS